MSGFSYTLPGVGEDDTRTVVTLLQGRLSSYSDLHLTLKHVHWNVVGSNFIGVHEMIDPQVTLVRGFADAVAERIAAMGGTPHGTPGVIVKERDWDDYPLGRNTVLEHLKALDKVYTVLLEMNRKVIQDLEKPDPVTQDLIIGQTAELEKFQWFMRAHLENAGA